MRYRIGRCVAMAALVATAQTGAALAQQATFASPEEALAAFRAAALAADGQALLQLLGPEHEAELIGGDPAAARRAVLRLQAAAEVSLGLEEEPDGSRTVVIGRQAWPMPVPLVEAEGRWRFDTAAGLDEIIARRVGDNELRTVALCRAYVDAQLSYASIDRDGDEVLEYAQKLLSTSGQRDGLYWSDDTDDEPSPLDAVAATEEDYTRYYEAGESFHGYSYRILTRQGENPPGAAYDYLINGNMIAGFALLAWPAEYGNSGVMTFAISHQGRVFQKDLGSETAQAAKAVQAYDPDPSWTEVTE